MSNQTARRIVPFLLIEVRWADDGRSAHFHEFGKYLPEIGKLQLVEDLRREKTYPDGLEIRRASEWLSTVSL